MCCFTKEQYSRAARSAAFDRCGAGRYVGTRVREEIRRWRPPGMASSPEMNIAAPKETDPRERRVALTPTVVEKLRRLGPDVRLERGFGSTIDVPDQAYVDAGAVIADRDALIGPSSLVVTVGKPGEELVRSLPPGALTISFLDPFRSHDLVRLLVEREVSAIAMELIPRTTYAQKMDALSSQASLAGYAAVIKAAEQIDKVFPMMTTPAGTIKPARVFVIGVGVAGLQAIATAKRLGARVEAYDTRPAVAEQVQSLGAKFVRIDVGETGETEQGYAKPLTNEQLEMQRQQMARFCAASDVVITTAQLFGRPAPRIVTADMLAGMRPGSVVVDLAASTGGNVEGSKPDEIVEIGGVRVLGPTNLPGEVARDASEMYASNVWNLIEHAWDVERAAFRLDPDDDVVGSCLLTHAGEVRDERVRTSLEARA